MISQQAAAFHASMIVAREAASTMTAAPSLAEMRMGAELVMQQVGVMPEDVTITETQIPGAPGDAPIGALWFEPVDAAQDRVVMYLHGGGYTLLSPRSHAKLTAAIAVAAGCRVCSVDYRLAPEHRHPAAVTDALAAYRWLLAEGFAPERIVLSGDSAGGGLALATLLAARDAGLPQPSAAVVMSPWADLECVGESMTTHAALDLQINAEFLRGGGIAYVGRGGDLRDPVASPVHGDFTGLAALYLQVGGHEVLLDDSTRIAVRAARDGVEVRLDVFPEMQHVHQIAVGMLPEADDAVARIGAYVRTRCAG